MITVAGAVIQWRNSLAVLEQITDEGSRESKKKGRVHR